MNSKGQGALEYLLIMAAAVIISAAIIMFMMTSFEQGVDSGQQGTNDYLCITLKSNTDACRDYIKNEYDVECPPKEDGFEIAFEKSIPIGCKRNGVIWAPKDETVTTQIFTEASLVCTSKGWRLPTITELGFTTPPILNCEGTDQKCPTYKTDGVCIDDPTYTEGSLLINLDNVNGYYWTSTPNAGINKGICIVGFGHIAKDKRPRIGYNFNTIVSSIRCVK